MKSLILRGCAAVALVSAMGCDVSVGQSRDSRSDRDDAYDDSPPPSRDTTGPVVADESQLSVEWTIEGAADPQGCDYYEVDHAYLTIEDDVGVVDEAEVACEAFGYDAPGVPSGTYWATIVLRDAAGNDLTHAADSDDTDVAPGDSARFAIDFDAASFL